MPAAARTLVLLNFDMDGLVVVGESRPLLFLADVDVVAGVLPTECELLLRKLKPPVSTLGAIIYLIVPAFGATTDPLGLKVEVLGLLAPS